MVLFVWNAWRCHVCSSLGMYAKDLKVSSVCIPWITPSCSAQIFSEPSQEFLSPRMIDDLTTKALPANSTTLWCTSTSDAIIAGRKGLAMFVRGMVEIAVLMQISLYLFHDPIDHRVCVLAVAVVCCLNLASQPFLEAMPHSLLLQSEDEEKNIRSTLF